MAAQPIRYPVEDKGRFVPVNKKQWISNTTIMSMDVHVEDDSGAHDAFGESSVK